MVRESKTLVNKRTLLLVTGFWVLFCGSRMLQDIAAAKLQCYDLFLPLTIVNYSSWLFWIPLTFLILAISKRYPIDRPDVFRGLLRHIPFAMVIIFLHYAFQWVVMAVTANYLFPEKRIEEYLSFVFYSLHLPVLIYFLIVAVHQGLSYILKLQKATIDNLNLEAQLFAAQNEALKMQIQPHFLFNTHHSIISLINQQKNTEAIEMLTGLSDLLRKTLNLTKGNYVSVAEEIEIVRFYLDIQQRRFRERLTIQCEIDESVKDARIPPFILQPLVENALVHGSQPISDIVQIKVCAKRVSSRLELIVSDNGVGIHKPITNGIGLTNTRLRLEKYYGENFKFSVMNNEGARGVVAQISIPLTYE